MTRNNWWILRFGNSKLGNCDCCGSTIHYKKVSEMQNDNGIITAYCIKCCTSVNGNEYFRKLIYEKNKLSDSLWAQKFGDSTKGHCFACDKKISKYDCETWFRYFIPFQEASFENIDICCLHCFQFIWRWKCGTHFFKENFQSKFKKYIDADKLVIRRRELLCEVIHNKKKWKDLDKFDIKYSYQDLPNYNYRDDPDYPRDFYDKYGF